MNEVTKTQIDNRRSLEEQISRPAPADALPLRVWTLRIHEEVAREIENSCTPEAYERELVRCLAIRPSPASGWSSIGHRTGAGICGIPS